MALPSVQQYELPLYVMPGTPWQAKAVVQIDADWVRGGAKGIGEVPVLLLDGEVDALRAAAKLSPMLHVGHELPLSAQFHVVEDVAFTAHA